MADLKQPEAMKVPIASSERAVTFISYAREDKEFVLRLADALKLKGIEVNGDWQLVRGENYQDQLDDLELRADAIVFVTSPDSVRSAPCRAELERAAEHKKRILPVVCRDLSLQEGDLPEPIRLPQWTHIRPQDDFVAGVQGLVEAINTDFDLMPEHRRLLQAAENWDRHQRSSSYLLRKDGLKRAEDWLTKTSLDPNKLPKPTRLQLDFIHISRSARTRGARIAVIVVSFIAVAMTGLAIVAFFQRGIAKREQEIAKEQTKEALKQKGIAEQQTKAAVEQKGIAEERRAEAEEATETERAARAVDLSQQAGREMEALTAAVLAAGNTIQAKKTLLRPALIEGLAAAVAAARHSLPLRGHTDAVDSAAFSADGTRLLTKSKEECIAKVWDTDDGRNIASFRLDANCYFIAHVSAASFSCDSKRIVTVCNYCTDRRNFLAQIWDARSGRAVLALSGHSDRLTAASFSCDSSRVVTASMDGTAVIWDANAGRSLMKLKVPAADGPGGMIYYATFSPDGTRVLTTHQDGYSRVWDANTGSVLVKVSGGKEAPSAAFYPDSIRFLLGGRLINVGGSGSACGWRAAELSPDGSLILSHNGHLPELTDTRTNKPIKPLYGEFGAGIEYPSDEIGYAGFSPDGRFVVTSGRDGTARTWSAHTGEFLDRLRGHANPVLFAAFAPDNQHIVTTSADRTARLWDTRVDRSLITLGEQLRELEIGKSEGTVHSASFSPEGKMVVTAHEDGFVRLWSAVTGTLLTKLDGSAPIYQAGFSPDGSRVIASTDAHTLLWNSRTKRLIATVDGTGRRWVSRRVDFSPDGNRFVTLTKEEWLLWDSHTGKLIQRGSSHEPTEISFSPDGRYIALVHNYGGDVMALELKTKKFFALVHNGRSDNFAVFSSDGLRIVTPFSPDQHRPSPPNPDRTVQVWETRTKKVLTTLQGHAGKVLVAAFSQDGSRLITGSEDHTARIWNVSLGKTIVTLDHAAEVRYVTFSPDGSQVLTLSGDHDATLWDSNTGHRLAMLQGHIGTIYAVAFSRNGTRIVTASRDATAKIYSADVSELVQEYLSAAFRLLRPQPEFQRVREIEPYLAPYRQAIDARRRLTLESVKAVAE